LVKSLVKSRDRTGPGTSGDDMSGAPFLPNLEQVVISYPQTAVHLQGVERWIKRHAKVNVPIAKIDVTITASYCKFKSKIKDLVDRLGRNKFGIAVKLIEEKVSLLSCLNQASPC
jgi:hypothetical protein